MLGVNQKKLRRLGPDRASRGGPKRRATHQTNVTLSAAQRVRFIARVAPDDGEAVEGAGRNQCLKLNALGLN